MGEPQYFSKDFDWQQLKLEIESNPSLHHHLTNPSSAHSQQSNDDAWNRFHARHSTGKFFKERRYLLKEFPELVTCGDAKLLEVGCGNGSTVLPILRGQENITVYACDCSSEALERATDAIKAADVKSACHRFYTFPCDFSVTEFPKWIFCDLCQQNFPSQCQGIIDAAVHPCHVSNLTEMDFCIGGMDFITLIFTLSAVKQDKMLTAVRNCFDALKPGGFIFFRDYGLYDMTMLRFDPNQKVGDKEYMRSDGTLSYFFCLDTVRKLFTDAGLKEVELEYCCVKSVNRRKGKSMRRVWVHGKFQKPHRDKPKLDCSGNIT